MPYPCVHHSRFLQSLSDVLVWQNDYTEDVIVTVTWPGYNSQTKYKMRTRFSISGSTDAVDVRLRYMYWEITDKIDDVILIIMWPG